MQRAIALLAGLLALCLATPAGAAIQSDNVTLLGKVPDSAGAIGARFSPDGATMYVTSATGLQSSSSQTTPRSRASGCST
jgi:hypothetical protein